MGCALCVIGSTVMVLHSPQEQEVASMDILKEKVQEPGNHKILNKNISYDQLLTLKFMFFRQITYFLEGHSGTR